MSSSTNPNVHSVAAQQITLLAAQTEEQKILEEAIQNVLPKCSRIKLSTQTIDRFKAAKTNEEFLRVFDELRAANKALKPLEHGSAKERIGQLAENVLYFKAYGTAAVQFSPGIGAPIWGLICATLTSIQNIQVTDESLNNLSGRLTKWSKRYSRLYESQGILPAHIRSELVLFHEISVEFAFAVASVFESNIAKSSFSVASKSLASEISKFSTRLSNAASDVDMGVLYETFIALSDSTLSQALPQANPIQASPATQTGPVTRKYCLPNMLTRTFTGRANVLTAVYDALNLQHVPTVPSRAAIHGIAGIGKSQTALQFANDNKAANSSGTYTSILYVRAGDSSTLLAEFCRLARALGLLKRTDIGEKYKDLVIPAVKDWLENASSWLLIFDNVRQTSDVLDYLPMSGDGHILFTTRSDIVAESLALRAGSIEVKPMDPEIEGLEFVLKLAPITSPYTEHDLNTARSIARFANGLPLVIEQIVTFSKQSNLSWHKVLDMVTNKTDILKRNAIISSRYREEELSAWAILDTVLKHLESKRPCAAELFKILVYLDTSSIPRALLHNAKDNINTYFQRPTTYDRGTLIPSRVRAPPERLNLFDFDPFSRDVVRWVFRRGEYSKKCTNTELPRTDSPADIEMEKLWRSSEKLIQDVFESPTNLDKAVNDLTNAGLLRTVDPSCLWIHDLFAQMGRTSLEPKSVDRGGTRAHLAATTVFLAFPIPEMPDPKKTVDKCMEYLPHAIACHNHLKSLGILSNTTIGPELSHLIASAIEAIRRKYSSKTKQTHTTARAVGYYKDAYLGYLDSWKRLQQIKGITWQRVVLSTFADYAWEDLGPYIPSRHLEDYERFGGSAPWRCISTMAKLGSLLSTDGEAQEAVKYLKGALKYSEEVFGPGHIDTSEITKLLMETYMRQKSWQDAYDTACRKAWAFMHPEKAVFEVDGEAIVNGLRDSVVGGEMARDIGLCCVEIPGQELNAAAMFLNELEAKRYVWGKESALCCGSMVRLARAYEKAGNLHSSIFWAGSAVELAIQDCGNATLADIEEREAEAQRNGGTDTACVTKRFRYGMGELRVLSDDIVAEFIARFNRLKSRVDNMDQQLEDMVQSWSRSVEVWEMMRSLDS